MELPSLRYEPDNGLVCQSTPLLLLHGLTASKDSWGSLIHDISNAISRSVIALDVRNHGECPITSEVADHMLMAHDVAKTLESLQISEAHVLGHSMGGKVAMVLALIKPELITSLIVVDVAPTPIFTDLFDAYLVFFERLKQVSLDLDGLTLNEKKLEIMKLDLDKNTLTFALDNLVVDDADPCKVRWQFNIDNLHDHLADILGWPDSQLQGKIYNGMVTFIGGDKGRYVSGGTFAGRDVILSYFPSAQFLVVADAGHWVQLDQHHAFMEDVMAHFTLYGQSRLRK